MINSIKSAYHSYEECQILSNHSFSLSPIKTHAGFTFSTVQRMVNKLHKLSLSRVSTAFVKEHFMSLIDDDFILLSHIRNTGRFQKNCTIYPDYLWKLVLVSFCSKLNQLLIHHRKQQRQMAVRLSLTKSVRICNGEW